MNALNNVLGNGIKRMNSYFLSEVEEEITVSDVVWFYGSIASMLVITIMVTLSTFTMHASAMVEDVDGTQLSALESSKESAEVIEETPYYGTNVGDGEVYTYTITAVIDNEVHGIPLTKASEGNQGIFLFADELDFVADEGDVIEVVWGEYEDEFVSIELVAEER